MEKRWRRKGKGRKEGERKQKEGGRDRSIEI